MKKKSIVFVLCMMIVMCAVLFGIWALPHKEKLGSMNHAYTEPTTSSSSFSFQGEAGDRIKFSFASEIQRGDLDMVLYDSKGNVVYELARAKELEAYYDLNETDEYTLAAEYYDFTGNFKIHVFKVD